MAAPIEFRYFLKSFSLADAESGTTPVRQIYPDGKVRLFNPPALQWRARERVLHEDNSVVGFKWGPWSDVLYVRAGDESPDAPPEPPRAA